MKPIKPRVQYYRKLGHLWRVGYGLPTSYGIGHGVTRRQATTQAKERFKHPTPDDEADD